MQRTIAGCRILGPSVPDVCTKYRVPSQIAFSNSLGFPCPIANFPCANYVICNYYIHKTDLADLSIFKNIIGNFRCKYRNIFYL